MAKGYDKSKKRKDDLNWFGKDLVRRSGSKCELCETSGVKLHVYEVGPVKEEPEFEKCILICETCQEQLDYPKRMDFNHWRLLNNSVWSEIAPIQVISMRVLKKIAKKESWAEDLLEQAYIDPELNEWIDKEEL